MTSSLSPGSADALLFDIGRVVLDISFDKVMDIWAGHAGCAPADLTGRFVVNDHFKHHEIGKIDDAAFFESLRTSLGIGITDDQFLEGWNAIFTGEMPDIGPLLARAGKHLPLYAFSNTNPAHVAHFSKAYADVLGHFREVFLSSSIGLRKPDAKAYDHVVKAIGVPASRIVFFDDSAGNIEGARAYGLKTVHVTSTDDVARALAALGIQRGYFGGWLSVGLMSAAGAGATGPLCPIVTAIPNNRHCPFTGANDNSKLTGLSNLLAPRIAPELVNSPMDWRRAT